MRRWPVCILLALTASAGSGLRAASDVNLNVPIFYRSMSSDLWGDLDTHAGFGGTVDFGRHGSPLHFAIGLQSSASTKSISNPVIRDAVGTVSELSFGVAKVWETKGRSRPFVGGGASFVNAQVDSKLTSGGDTNTERDDSLGLYVEGGVYWRLSKHFNFGLQGRVLGGTKINLFGEDGNADYWQVGPMIGWSWPPR